MTGDNNSTLEVLFEKKGGADVWLMPLALIGCVVVLGPLMAYGFQRIPDNWLHDHTVWLTVAITAATAVVLILSYFGAQALVRWGHCVLKLDGDTVAVCNHNGSNVYSRVGVDEAKIEARNWIVNAQSGRFIEPVIWIELPELKRLSVTVDSDEFQWDESAVGDCELEADYMVTGEQWPRLVRRLGLDDKMIRS